jgi:hypothetical protein
MNNKKNIIILFCNLTLICWVIFLLNNYKYIFGGDPEIHLIFAKNFLQGYFLEFNKNYKTGGETSPLYMILVAFIYLLVDEYTQYAMKFVGICSLLLLGFLLYKSTKSDEILLKIFPFVLLCSMTFIPFQAMLGMENMLFAALLMLIIYFSSIEKLPNFAIILLIPLAFTLRPEGIFLALYFFLNGILFNNRMQAIYALIAVISCILIYAALNQYSVINTHNAGSIRALTSKIDSLALNIGPTVIYVSKKPIIGFVYAWVLLLLFFLNRKKLNSNDCLLLFCFLALPFILHLFNILPNSHFSRYVIYCYAIVFFVFSQRILPFLHYKVITLLALIFLAIAFLEFNQRQNPLLISSLTVQDSVEQLRQESIKKNSDNFASLLLNNGNFPITIATSEVQLRGRLDERFLIWSLDGITDAALSKFSNKNQIDLFSYIKYREINYLEDLPNYNIDRKLPSLSNFEFDINGSSQCISGVSLKKIDKPYLMNKVLKCDLMP